MRTEAVPHTPEPCRLGALEAVNGLFLVADGEHRSRQRPVLVPGAEAGEKFTGKAGDNFPFHAGVVIEDKTHAIAVHYRQAPTVKAKARAEVRRLVEGRPDLQILDGKMVFEIKSCGIDKGTAIKAFMAEPPFVGRTPIFLGDDITDEDGFAIVNDLGGHSIRVGGRAKTAARFRLPNVTAVIEWLNWLAEDLEHKGAGVA